MHSKWGIIAVLAALAAAVLITLTISGCPSAPQEQPVIVDDVPPPDLTPPTDEGAVTNEPTEGEEAVTNEAAEGEQPAEGEGAEAAEGEAAPAPDAPPADPTMDAPPADAPAAGG